MGESVRWSQVGLQGVQGVQREICGYSNEGKKTDTLGSEKYTKKIRYRVKSAKCTNEKETGVKGEICGNGG